MAQKTSVVRNRITIDERVYDARVLGGGKFNVFDAAGVRIGMFAVKGRAVEAEDVGVEGADPVEQIGLLWVRENLSAQPAAKPADPAPEVKAPPAQAASTPPAVKPEAKPSEPTAVTVRSVATAPVAAQATTSAASVPDPASMSAPLNEPKAGRPRSICRVATHDKPDAFTLARGIAYQAWLKTQAGVLAAYLSQNPDNGKVTSVTIWEDREKLAAMRYAKPPAGAVQLKSVSVELLWILE